MQSLAIAKPQSALEAVKTRKLPRTAFIGLLTQLRNWIAKLVPADTSKTVWGNYATANTYTDDEAAAKRRFIAEFIENTHPWLVCDLGCNTGDSSILITKLLRSHNSDRKFAVYDSFEGLPPAKEIDGEIYKEGYCKTNEDVLRNNFKKYNLPVPEIHKGWFQDTLPDGLPERIAFAYLDGDFYDSILVSLQYVYPKLSPGAVCLIDDYCDPQINPKGWNRLPGVKKACDEYLADKPEKMEFIYSGPYSHAFFRKAGFSKS